MKKTALFLGCSALLFSCADYDQLDKGPPPPSELTVSGVRDSTVTLRWTMCDDENFRSYKVYCDSSDAVSLGDMLLDSFSLALDTVLTARHLKPATGYWFRVFTTNQAGKPAASNTAGAVTWIALASKRSGDSAAILTWTPLRNIPVNGYTLFRDTTDNVDTSDARVGQFPAADTSCFLRQCAAGKTWRFRVFAVGDSDFGTPSTVTRVTGWWFKLYRPLRIGDTAAELHWARPSGKADGFKVFYDTKPGVDTGDSAYPRTIVDTFMTIGNLDPKLRYRFKVYAFGDESGYSAWTGEDSVSQLPAAPVLEVASVRDTTVSLRWNRWTGPGDEFRCYRIYLDTNGSIDQGSALADSLSSIKDTSADVTGLQPATRYFFRMYVTDNEGKTSFGKPVGACTGLRLFDRGWQGDSAKRLEWTRIKGQPATAYKVYGDSTSDQVDSTDAVVQSDSVLTVAWLPAGVVWRYRVYAAGGIASSSGVVPVSGWFFKLYPPNTAADSVSLHWARVKNAAKYRIYRGPDAAVDTADTLCADVAPTDTTVKIGIPSPKSVNWFKVYALDNNGVPVAWTKPDSARLR